MLRGFMKPYDEARDDGWVTRDAKRYNLGILTAIALLQRADRNSKRKNNATTND